MSLPYLVLLLAAQQNSPRLELDLQRHRPPEKVEQKDLTVENGEVRLAASLFLPKGAAPYPAVVITHGSEPASRQMLYYQTVAELFAANGIAALIYDKRGVGESTGEYVELPDLRNPASDLVAMAKALGQLPQINADHIGVIGSSQAGWVEPLAASMSPEIKFVVCVSGTPVSPLEQGFYVKSFELKRQGLTDEQTATILNLCRKAGDYMKTGSGYEELKAERTKLKEEQWFAPYERTILPPIVPPTYLNDPSLEMFRNSHRMLYDPLPALKALKVPLLWIFGDRDESVDPINSRAILERVRTEAGLTLDVKTFPDANHGLLVSMKEGVFRYAPGYFDFLLDWIQKQVGPTGQRGS